MSSYLLKFGSFTLPGTMRPNGSDANMDLAEQELPRLDGSVTQVGRRKSRMLTVKGAITADTADNLQTVYDAMRAALAIGAKAELWFGRDDRWANAQVESWTDDTADGMTFGVVVNIAVSFRMADPYWYAGTAGSANSATVVTGLAAGGTVTPAHSTPAIPVWTIVVSGTAAGSITVTNSTTGEAMVLAGSFTNGDTIVVDRGAYTVTLNGTPTFGLLSGRIPSLAAGANTITTAATGVSIGSLSSAYLERYN